MCNRKGFVLYIFASLFCSLKECTFETREMFFLFHFKSAFLSWDNQILTFQVFKCNDVIQYLRYKTRNTFYWITWGVNIVWCWHLASLCNITKDNFLHKKKCSETNSRPFLIFEESSAKWNLRRFGSVLIWINFDSLANIYPIQVACFKSFILQ